MPFDAVECTTSITLNATPQQLWPLISDTSRVNRLIGLPPAQRIEPGDAMTQTIHSHYYGFPVTWTEHPFEWVFEQWFESERALQEPLPVHQVITATRLTPLEDGKTQIDVRVMLTNRNPLGWAACQLLVGRQMLRDMTRVYRSFETTLLAAEQARVLPLQRASVNSRQLDDGLEQLRRLGLPLEQVELLGEHLRHGEDNEVLKMRPFELAERWHADHLDVLRLCLYATRSGLLDLEWDVLCPHCRGPNERAARMSDLIGEVHCPACNIRYDLNFDEAVELRFSVSQAIREAIDLSYCIGGPANTPHILAQIRVPAHKTRTISLRTTEGQFRLRSAQIETVAQLVVRADATATASTITVDEQGFLADELSVKPGVVVLSFNNTSDNDALLIVEDRAWSRLAASAAVVTALDEFRQLFSSEVLAPGIGLAVRNLTFLFSDLKDSTAIYDTLGDAPAFARVRDHFAVMRGIINGHRGALVKTIGDAVMAVFVAPADAFAAALDIQREFTDGEIAQGRPALRLKIGLHRGPCIAVNANDLLDYFGSTVNTAARVQAESRGGDIVISNAVAEDSTVQQMLNSEQHEREQFERELKGISQRANLLRLTIMPALATAEAPVA